MVTAPLLLSTENTLGDARQLGGVTVTADVIHTPWAYWFPCIPALCHGLRCYVGKICKYFLIHYSYDIMRLSIYRVQIGVNYASILL